MRIALACLLLVAACGKKPAARSAASSAAPAPMNEEKESSKPKVEPMDAEEAPSRGGNGSKRSGDPCEGGQ